MTGDTAGGSVTGQVLVAGYALEVGAPTGAQVTGAETGETAEAQKLKAALAQEEAAWKETLSERVDEASDATGKAERALTLFTAVAQGRLDAASVKAEVDAMLDLLDRLDKEERWQEALDLARAMSGLLGLLMRWVQLVGSLRLALRVAGSLNDVAGVGWAKHELGSLELVAGDTAAAERSLGEARDIREGLGDGRGLAATERNLQVLCKDLRRQLREGQLAHTNGGGFFRRGRIVAAIVVLALLLAGGVAGAVVDGGGGGGNDTAPPAGDVRIAIRTPVEGARFSPGQRVLADYSCAVRDGSIRSCIGDRRNEERIDTRTPGRHTFTVTATTEDGRRATESVSYTVSEKAIPDRGRPEISIVTPAPGTISAKPRPVADFSCIDEPGGSGIADCYATLDGDPERFGSGRKLPVRGSHVLRVFAVDAAGNRAGQTVGFNFRTQPTSDCDNGRDDDRDGETDDDDLGCQEGRTKESDAPAKCDDGTFPPCEEPPVTTPTPTPEEEPVG